MQIAGNKLLDLFLLQKEFLGTEKPINATIPLVSVTIITYQHVNYIEKCLDSILMQQTAFPFEIVIGDDGSTDGTQEICIAYANKYPDKIRLFIRDRKQSQYYLDGKFICRFNGAWTRMSARGQYIAWCEGDDYWIGVDKLQKQVDFLDANPDISLVFSNRILINETGQNIREELHEAGTYTTSDIFAGFIPNSQTMMYRNLKIVEDYFKYNVGIYSGDRYISYLCALVGNLYRMEDVTAAYRDTGKGVWSSFSEIEKIEKRQILLEEFHKSLGWNIHFPTYAFFAFDKLMGILIGGIKNPRLFFNKEYRKLIFIIWHKFRYMNRSKLLRRALVSKIKNFKKKREMRAKF